jgi:hypothetical protein
MIFFGKKYSQKDEKEKERQEKEPCLFQENSFEKKYEERERRVRMIERIVFDLQKRYEKYEELREFIIYLGATEKIFLGIHFNEKNILSIKKALVENDIEHFSQNSGMDKEILENIHREFQLSKIDIRSLREVADRLMQKYADCLECKNFIIYIRDIYIIFLGGEKKVSSVRNFQENIVLAKMKMLSSDGDPKFSQLEEIYEDFKSHVYE